MSYNFEKVFNYYFYFRGYCKHCAQQLTLCPVCRQLIDRYQESIQQPPAMNIAVTALVS